MRFLSRYLLHRSFSVTIFFITVGILTGHWLPFLGALVSGAVGYYLVDFRDDGDKDRPK